MEGQFVQYLSIGTGFIENTQKIKTRNIEECIEKSIDIEDKTKDIQIIGFRFFDRDKKDVVCNISGIFYLRGEVITYPKVSTEMLQFLKNIGAIYKKGQQLIITGSSTPIVYEFMKEDKLVDLEEIKENIKRKKQAERATQLKKDIEAYKTSVCIVLTEIAENIKVNNYKYVTLKEVEETDVFALNILGDGGNFKSHIDKLKSMHKELYSLEESLSGIGSLISNEK